MARCKVEYKQGFNETKKNLYNNYINFLFGQVVLEANDQGFFVSLGSNIDKVTSDILYKIVSKKILSNIYEVFDQYSDQQNLTILEVKEFYNNFNATKKQRKQIEQQLDLIHIIEEFPKFIIYNKTKSKLSLDEDTNEDTSKPERFKDTITESVWNRGDFFIRNLFLTIPKLDKKGNIVIDKHTKLPIMADGVSLFNQLSLDLADSTDYNHFFLKLNSTRIKNKYPELRYLTKLFPDSTKEYQNINPIAANQFKTAFYQTLNKAHVPPIGLVIDPVRNFNKQFVANRSLVIRSKWQNNFLNQDLKNNKYVKEIEGERVLVELPPIEKRDAQSIQNYLSYFGIELDPDILSSKINKKGDVEDILFGGKKGKGLVNNLKEYFKLFVPEDKGIPDFIEYFKEAKEDDKSDSRLIQRINTAIRDLLKIESEYSTLQVSLTHINAKGDQQSVISERNSFTIMLNILNNSKNVEEVYERLPVLRENIQFQPGSYWYDTLFDQFGNKHPEGKITISNYSGIENRINTSESEGTAEMNQRNKLIMDINMTMGNTISSIDLPRTSTSDTYYSISLNNNKLADSQFHEIMTNYLINEIKAVKSGKAKDYFIFKTLISEESLNQAKKGDYKLALSDIDKYFKRHLNSLKRGFDVLNLTAKDPVLSLVVDKIQTKNGVPVQEKDISITDIRDNLIKETVEFSDKKLTSFLHKHFINSVEASYLFTGNPGNFKDFTKRFKGGLSTGIPMDTNPDIENILNKEEIEGNAYSIRNLLSVDRRDNSNTFQVKTFKDSYVPHAKTIKNLLAKTKLGDKVLNPYNNINIADGQGLINIDFYREFLMKTGNWSDQKELTAIYEGLFFKKNILKKKLTKLEQTKFDSIQELINNDDKGIYSLSPLKAQYDGPYAELDTHELSMDKFSLVPILPSIAYQTNNKQWLKLIKDLAVNNIGYVKYESAAKGYKPSVVDFNTGLNNPEKHYSFFLKEQTRTASSLKDIVTWGTQFRKLLFSGLFDNTNTTPRIKELYDQYINLIKDVAADAKESLSEDLGLELDIENKTVTIKDYKKLVTKLRDLAEKLDQPTSIIDALEYNPETGELLNPFETTGASSIVTNMLFGMIDKKLRAWKTVGNQYIQVSNDTFENLKFYDLVKETNKTSKAQIRITLTGEFRKLLNLKYDGERIGTIERLNEALKNKLWRNKHENHLTVIAYRIPTQEMNSMEYLEVVQFLSPTAGNIVQLYDEITAKSGSDFDIDKLSIFLPSFDENGNYISAEYSDVLQKELKELEAQYNEIREISNSEIFYDEDMDLTTQNIDNLFKTIFGEKADINATDLIPELTDELNKKYRDLKRYLDLKVYKKARLTNNLIEIYSEIFQQPESFEQLVKPNDASLVNEIFKENFKNDPDNKGKTFQEGLPSGATVFDYLTNLDLHARLKLAGRHLGIYAVANTSHAIATQNGLNINPVSYSTVYILNKETGEMEPKIIKNTIQLSLLTEDEQKMVLNDNGTINMASNFDVEGNSIQSILSKLIDVTVDPEKNPQYLYSNINNSNISLVLYLLRQRVPFKRIIQFISLPYNKAYFKAKELGTTPRKVKPSKEEVLSLGTNGLSQLETELKKSPDERDSESEDYLEKSYQILVRLEREASYFTTFTQHYNYDTSKINTPIALLEKEVEYKKLKADNFVNIDTLEKWNNDTIVSQFNNTNFIKNISSQVLPILFDSKLIRNFYETVSQTKLNQSLKVNLEKIILQEYIQSIYEHFGSYKGTTLGLYGSQVLSTDELYKKIRKYSTELPEFNIFKQISPEKFPGKEIYNLRIIRDINNKSQQVNILSQELENLMSYSENEDEDINLEIQEMAKDLSVLAIKQGLSKSRFYMEDIVPLSFKQDLYTEAIENYLKFIDPANVIPLLDGPMENNFEYYYTEFENKFVDNFKNKYFPRLERSSREYSLEPGYKFTQSELGLRVNDYTFELPIFSVLTDEQRSEMVRENEIENNKPKKVSKVKVEPLYSEKVNKIINGAFISKNRLTKDQQIEVFEYLKPYLETQGKKTNMGLNAPVMIGLGLRWDYKRNNPNVSQVEIGPNIAGKQTSYAYYNRSINDLELGEIPNFIKDYITEYLDLNVQDYDGAIINVYDQNSFIGNHSDLEESADAKNRPVTVINIGGNGNIVMGPNNSRASQPFEDGSVYAFGVDGVNRTVPHSTYASEIKGFLPELYIALENKTYPAGSYRITVTLRKVLPTKELNESVISSEDIYPQLTKSDNVNIVPNPNKFFKDQTYGKAVVAYRNSKDNRNFGNPFTKGTTEQNVKDFIDWIITDKFNNIEPERVSWIREMLNEGVLKGLPIYYGNTKATKENSIAHADALDYLINKYDKIIEVGQKNPIFAESVEIDKNKLNNCKYGL